MAAEGHDGDVSIDAGIEATRGMFSPKQLPFPSWTDQASGRFSFSDLPLKDAPRDKSLVKHIFDIINDVPLANKTAIGASSNEGNWGPDVLPAPFCKGHGTPYALQWQGHAMTPVISRAARRVAMPAV